MRVAAVRTQKLEHESAAYRIAEPAYCCLDYYALCTSMHGLQQHHSIVSVHLITYK